MSKFHHFRFSIDHPGKVFCRLFADSPEEEFQMLKNQLELPPIDLPPQVVPSGVDLERKNYLFREIRQFCQPDTEDFVAPAVP